MLVRTDLPTSQQLVQAVHAAHAAGRFCVEEEPAVVVCRAPTEDQLLREYHRITRRGINCTLFREPDIEGQATALATEAVDDRRPFRKWQLWKDENNG